MKTKKIYNTLPPKMIEKVYSTFVRACDFGEKNETNLTKKQAIIKAKTEIRNAKIAAELSHVEDGTFREYKGVNNAALGLAFELACSFCGKSSKTKVSKAGRDNTVYINGKGYSLECKTNGGGLGRCFEHYEDGRAANEYVAYFYDVCNSSNGYERQVFAPVLIPMTTFVEFFIDNPKAIRNSDGDEPHIQSSNASFKQFISEWDTVFEFDTDFGEE